MDVLLSYMPDDFGFFFLKTKISLNMKMQFGEIHRDSGRDYIFIGPLLYMFAYPFEYIEIEIAYEPFIFKYGYKTCGT